MRKFASVHSYQRFAASVMRQWRYTRDKEQKAFIDAVISTSGSRYENVKAGAVLYRAKEGCDWPPEEEYRDPGPRAYDVERMKPLPNRAPEGRVNPRGIPCLYTATRLETAVAEVRPWIGAYVSVAQMKVLRPLKLVNCTSKDKDSLIV